MTKWRPNLALGVMLATSLTTAGCCSDPWRAHPHATAPDRSCSTGSVQGYDVYVWDCLEGRHVVVAQYSAEMTCQGAVEETSACGSPTPLESKLRLTASQCSGPRAGREWRSP